MNLYFPTISKSVAQYHLQKWKNEKASLQQMKFELTVPKEFILLKQENNPPSLNKPIVDCAFFMSPNKEVQVIVECLPIQCEVSLENYFTCFAKKANEVIINKRLLEDNTDMPDILLKRKFPDGQLWITRRTGYKYWNGNGAFVIAISTATSLGNYVKYADLLFTIVSSLKPLVKPEYAQAERLKKVSKRYPLDFSTYIPYSWEHLHHHNDTLQEMNLAYIKKLRGLVTGIFSITCIGQDTNAIGLKEVLEKVHKPYTNQGADFSRLEIQKSVEIRLFSSLTKGSLDFLTQKDVLRKKNNITFYLGKKSNRWFYVEMVGPAKETDFEAWAINDRAMEIVKNNLVTI